MPRIAIIGGGIAGSSVCYKLDRMFTNEEPTVEVYEADEIGGRMRTITLGGVEYEAGGTIIHPDNQHMVKYAEMLGLQQVTSSDSFGLFRGTDAVFEVSANSWLSSLQLLWRYGMSLFSLQSNTNKFLQDFERIYKWQKEHQAFTSVPNILMSMSDEVMNATQVSTRDYMISHGVSELLVDELALAACRVNYGQSVDKMNAFVGSVSVAGATPGLWSVKGGNRQVPQGLLKECGAKVMKSKVIKITNMTVKAEKPLYRLETEDGTTNDYDVVVLATPLIEGQKNVEFVDFKVDMTQFNREFHTTFTYFIQGVPNYKRFGYKILAEMPDTVFPIDKDSFYNVLEKVHPSNGQPPKKQVYKVFANQKLSEAQLNMLFESREITELIDWLAYPEYNSNMEFVPFVLAPKLYYTSAIEFASSCMEMSAIAGHNIANLIMHQLMENEHLVDNMFIIEEKHIKIEL